MEDRRRPWALMPAVVLVVGGFVLPLLWTLASGAGSLSWVVSWQVSTLVNSAVWIVGGVLGGLVLGLVVLAATWRMRGRAVLTAMAMVPAGLTLAVVAVVWRAAFAFRPAGRAQVGIVNEVVTTAGLSPVAWLTQEPLVNTVVLTTALVWAVGGLVAYLLGAVVDRTEVPARRGARPTLRRDLLPALRSPLAAVALGIAVVAIRTHDIVRVATSGMFGTEVLSTESVDRSFVDGQPSRGAALGIVLVLLALPVALLALRRRGEAPLAPGGTRRRGRHSRLGPPAEVGDEHADEGRSRARSVVAAGVALVVVGVVLLPLVGIVVTALRPAADVAADGWWNVALDPTLTLDNLREVLGDGSLGGAWGAIVDSLLVTVPATALVVGVAWITARALADLEPRLDRLATATLVVAAVVPLAAVVRPVHDALDAVGLTGTLPGAWLAHLAFGLPLATLLVRRGIRTGDPTTALVAAACVQLLLVWNDYLVAVAVLGGDGDVVPATVHLATLVASRGEELHLVAAAAVATAAVPVVVLLSARGVIARALVGTPAAASVEAESRLDGPRTA